MTKFPKSDLCPNCRSGYTGKSSPRKKKGRWYSLALILTLSVLFNTSLIIYRNVFLTGCWKEVPRFSDLLGSGLGPGFLFLVWNLFLAWIPYGLSLLIRRHQAPGIKYFLMLLWLVFLPNAPYIITDFLHLYERPPVPLWYDVLTIFAFAWTGLTFGYLSLVRVYQAVSMEWGRTWSYLFFGSAVFLAGLGVYIGRFLRWNSWDILARPGALFADIFSIITDPALHWPALGAGFLLAVMLFLGYSTLLVVRRQL